MAPNLPELIVGAPLVKGQLLTEPELDDAVHRVQLWALSKGMIPIAAIISRRLDDGRHELLGFGHNHLAEGIPGIHGETGALINMGRQPGGYAHLIATSSLNPCPFCQRTLACHLGIKEVRILDAENYSPDLSSYPATLQPTVSHHDPTADTFKAWVTNPLNTLIWQRDIGIFDGPHAGPVDVAAHPEKVRSAMRLAHLKAREGLAAGEAPIGAVVLDDRGEVIGAGHARVKAGNDPTLVASMAVWRGCGARAHWKDKTLVLTCGPDHIAYSMFKVFNFGQLVVGSAAAFSGQLPAVAGLKVPVHVLGDSESDANLCRWQSSSSVTAEIAEYLGVLR